MVFYPLMLVGGVKNLSTIHHQIALVFSRELSQL